MPEVSKAGGWSDLKPRPLMCLVGDVGWRRRAQLLSSPGSAFLTERRLASKGKHLEEGHVEATTFLGLSLRSHRASLLPFYPGWSSPEPTLPQIHQEETRRPRLSGKAESAL